MRSETGQQDRSLLERAWAEATTGRSDALEALVTAHFPAINAFLRHRFGNVFSEEERSGLFLDVLYHYVRRPTTYDPSRPLQVLLCAAVHNNATRILLRRRPQDLTDPAIVDTTVGSEDRELGRVDDRELLEAMAGLLDKDDRQILLAPKDEKGWAVQLGGKLGLTPNAVAKRWERIRGRMRASFSETGDKPC